MYLEKLEINGFKSFAKKEKLEFKPGITAVVGPNGSGKSNVADAIRWVLGEQSIKLLRGKKSEDVIFSGSDKKARLGMAEVSLHFNNEKDKASLDMSQIVITRRLYRNGDSDYLINSQKTRLTDIQMLLARAGVAKASYSIIGQGMIDQFLLSSPAERKEFFEEASGVKPLQIKRATALNKLDLTEENLETATIQLNEITPRLNSLTRQVKKLEQRAEVELKLRSTQGTYFSSLWHEIEGQYKNRHSSLKERSTKEQELKNITENYQQKMLQLTQEKSDSEGFEKLQSKYQEFIEQKMKLTEELSSLKIKQAQISSREIKGKNIPHDIGQQIQNLITQIKDLRNKIEASLDSKDYGSINDYFTKQNDLLNEIDTLLKPYSNVPSEKPAATEDNSDLISDLEKQITNLEKLSSEKQAEIKKETQKEKQERSEIWDIQQKYQSKQQELNSISGEVNNYRIEIARFETKKDDLEHEIREDFGDLEQIKQNKVDVLSEDQKRSFVTDIAKLKHQLEQIGGIDPEVKSEYDQIKVRHEFLSTQIEDLRKSIDSLEKLILELDENIKAQFDKSFKIINEKFAEHFKTLFAGGHATLKLLKDEIVEEKNENDTEEQTVTQEKTEVQRIKERLAQNMYSGVEIEATPPGKKLKNIGMLSGGERAMTSIALLCAILSANPSPFVVLDEVDAALDEANSIRYANIVEQLASKSQFIIITHNRATMEKADILYGVTMGDDGVSTLLSLKLESAEQYTNR